MDDKTIISLLEKYKGLELSKSIDFDKFNQYAITHHSTTIEGSTLDIHVSPVGKIFTAGN